MTVLFSSWLLVAWAGGPDEVSRVMHAAGPFAPLVLLSGLVELIFLTLMICQIGAGRVVPLAVMLGMTTLPWTVGLLGTEAIIGRIVPALSELEAPDARNALALGVGQAMASRMLGAWMSAGLLLGLGLGLTMAGASSDAPWRSSPRGNTAGLVFGVVIAVVLAAIALVGALEAHQLFEQLTRLAQAPLPERVSLLRRAAEEVARLQPFRHASQALLATLGVVLLVWQARKAARPASGWMGSIFLAAAVTALLVLDGHPLRSAVEGARAAGLSAPELPTDFNTLATHQDAMPHPLAALATLEGLVPTQGDRLSWSTPAKTIADTLSSSLSSTVEEPSTRAGVTPEPVLPLLADARLSGAAMRRLLEASALSGARSVELVGQHPHAANSAMLERLEARSPLLSLLAARAGTLTLLLPSALPRADVSWRARFEAGGTLVLSPAQGGDTLTLSLHASPADVPEVLAGTFVGLELPEHVSLKDLGAAADVLGLAGASPVVLLDARPIGPGNGGTDTRWSAHGPGLPEPELLRHVVEIHRLGVETMRQAHEWLHAPESRLDVRPLVADAQSSQMSSTMAATSPMPNTTSIVTPSNFDDTGSFGAPSGPDSLARATGVVGISAAVGRSAAWVTTEASRSSRPSRASASTRFMWSM